MKSLFMFDLRRMEKIRRLVHDKELAILETILDSGVAEGAFKADRCELLRRFLIRCLNGVTFAGLGSDNLEQSRSIHSAFVEYIITDIKADK